MKNKQGFTLMEILAVLLVIAVIASFAVPMIKSVRREMRYQKAKAASVQLAEAVRSFYTDTKGCLTTGEFHGTDSAGGTCPTGHPIKTGVPPTGDTRPECTGGVTVVFKCGYISPKMFVDLPYQFEVLDPRVQDDGAFIRATEQGETSPRSLVVNRDMTITEDED